MSTPQLSYKWTRYRKPNCKELELRQHHLGGQWHACDHQEIELKLHQGSVSKPKNKFWLLIAGRSGVPGAWGRRGIHPTHFQAWMEYRRSYKQRKDWKVLWKICMANIPHTLTHFGPSKLGEVSVPYWVSAINDSSYWSLNLFYMVTSLICHWSTIF